MKTIIFFIILAHGELPVNKIYKVLNISKTTALRLSAIIKTCSIAKKIVKRIQKDTSLTIDKIIYYYSPDFDSAFKYNKGYHSSLRLANKDIPRCRRCRSYNVEILELSRRSVKCQQCFQINELQDKHNGTDKRS